MADLYHNNNCDERKCEYWDMEANDCFMEWCNHLKVNYPDEYPNEYNDFVDEEGYVKICPITKKTPYNKTNAIR